MLRVLRHLGLAVLLALAGWGGLLWLRATQAAPPSAPHRALPPVPIETVVLGGETLARMVTAHGTLAASRSARLAPEVGGRVVEVHPRWRPGARVEAGELLWAVDERQLAAQEARLLALDRGAQAELAAAGEKVEHARTAQALGAERLAALEREEARWTELVASGHGRDSRLDVAIGARAAAGLALEEARALERAAGREVEALAAHRAELAAALEGAQLERAKARVVAPFDGILDGHAPAVGGVLAPLEPLGQLLDVAPLRLAAFVPEERLGWLRLGAPARVILSAQPGRELRGVVAALGAGAEPATRSVSVELDVFDAEDEGLPPTALPGMSASAEIEGTSLPDALLVAEEWLVREDGGPALLVPERAQQGWIAVARPVELGPRFAGRVLVRAGIAAGDTVIVRPLAGLRAGAEVQPPSEGER